LLKTSKVIGFGMAPSRHIAARCDAAKTEDLLRP
jgi:hypothetical protein